MATQARCAVALLAVLLAAAVLAGCAQPSPPDPSEGSLTIRVDNQAANATSFSVSVTDAEGGIVDRFEDERVQPGVSTTLSSGGFDSEGPFSIHVSGEGWATSGLWDPPVCMQYSFVTLLSQGEDRPSVSASASCDEDG